MRHTLFNYIASIALALSGLVAIPTTAAAAGTTNTTYCGAIVGPSTCTQAQIDAWNAKYPNGGPGDPNANTSNPPVSTNTPPASNTGSSQGCGPVVGPSKCPDGSTTQPDPSAPITVPKLPGTGTGTSSGGCGPVVGPSKCPDGSTGVTLPEPKPLIISTRPCMVIPGKEGCTVVTAPPPIVVSTRPCMVIPGKEGCTEVSNEPVLINNSKKIVDALGVTQAQPKPNVCATRPESFKGCAAFK